MTDRELGLRLAESFPNFKLEADAWEAVASRARELLSHEAVSVKLDHPQLDRIEKEQGYQSARSAACVAMLHGLAEREIRIEKKLDWLKWHATPARLVPSGEWIENPLLVPTRQETLRVEQATEPEWPK